MQNKLTTLTYEIELKPGEKLNLPESILENITTGHWVITIQQKAEETKSTRSHDAFLNGYAPQDEGLYDDYPSR
ncbi:MAG: hypothetical protein RMZ41_016500 [Nostoc sp. DedVER02]|uniref:hypothetical protein n=1 Tax=unclassified Nostoc TaxID=2593658 RepID=UPI002AD355EA|nr:MULTISPECIES: hypothetical protein [unclassified Nostoc]MDZ7988452.1 hypothetical protein [Nostoc sp. DedVER02]MDZ8112190.1 hypothetical protein [Nostoc sp. DedVER01b]